MTDEKPKRRLHMRPDEFRARVAEQDRQWREQGRAEEGGSREGWGLADNTEPDGRR